MSTQQVFRGKLADYEVTDTRPLIIGRVSVFYSVVQKGSGKEYLAKVFDIANSDDGDLGAFYREIDTLSKLNHPNILSIIDYSHEAPGSPAFLILPWCKGGSLADLIRTRDYFAVESIIGLLRQIASAVDHAHNAGVIHGDIKPQNILLPESRDLAFLADFGMARYFDISDRVTLTGPSLGGTSAYLSPEQLRFQRQSPRSDVYSLGLVAYELLAGRLPYELSAPLYEQLHARITGALRDPREFNPSIPRNARDALLCALAVNPEDRPTSAASFCDMLTGRTPVPATSATQNKNQRDISSDTKDGNRLATFWNGLDAAGRAGVITAAIAALGALAVALVGVITALVGGGK